MMTLREVGWPAVIVMLVTLPLLIAGLFLSGREDRWRYLGKLLLAFAIPYIGAAEVLGFAIYGTRVAPAVGAGAVIGAVPIAVLAIASKLLESRKKRNVPDEGRWQGPMWSKKRE